MFTASNMNRALKDRIVKVFKIDIALVNTD